VRNFDAAVRKGKKWLDCRFNKTLLRRKHFGYTGRISSPPVRQTASQTDVGRRFTGQTMT